VASAGLGFSTFRSRAVISALGREVWEPSMDAKLLGWARAAARRWGRGPALPPLWLFTDARRVADPRPVVARLPKGLAGVVLRHDGEPGRVALGRDLARLCRARRLRLVVAGDPWLAAALGAGVHLRGGRWPTVAPVLVRRRRGALVTSSAHGVVELRRAARAGVDLAFLSPAFATRSHPDASVLGSLRWGRFARGARLPVAALGGIGGATVRRLPRGLCRAAGAIEALGEVGAGE
jgi:thiamine-phosphate pyrophosphorylase